MGKYQNIMVALVGDGSEQPVVEQAVLLAEQFQSKLSAIHVNDLHAGGMSMMMDSPKKITADMIRDQMKDFGFERILEELDIIITKGENIAKSIEPHCQGIDMLILGHRKMSDFKANITDSVDEGITNLVACPVLVVQKD
jgi:nucleotide-binding universal stress UspA family protein